MGRKKAGGSTAPTQDGRFSSRPATRRLQVYSVDPSIDTSLATAGISRSVLSIRWEKLAPGPVGEYVEVIDVDPSSGRVYDPVDLEHAHVVAHDGLPPSEGNPQFHQQMVYAVVMKTVENFEKAMGRPILWAERRTDGTKYLNDEDSYVPRLRIYPHALREANAYYSPAKKALLFGYFNAPTTDPREELPGGMVFTCLSHDIIAHETTHAILDGLHRRLLEAPTNSDMLAFHEAFADIVAIFQHFTLPGLLLDQLQRTRGDLAMDSLLATLAVQFGRATKRGGALRNALGRFDPQGRREAPDPSELGRTTAAHPRGAILVAAVFDAFLRIYEHRVRDLRRIASNGTGILPQGDIHPDLARRFADEAVKAAQRVLSICIRALDYLPPVDQTFGDYLRALVTADSELVPDDPRRYRLAFIEAFRNRGIFPADVRALGEDSLRWRKIDADRWKARLGNFLPPPEVLRTMVAAWEFEPIPELDEQAELGLFQARADQDHERLRQLFLTSFWKLKEGRPTGGECREPNLRRNIHLLGEQFSRMLYYWLAVATMGASDEQLEEGHRLLGLDFRGFRNHLRKGRVRPPDIIRGSVSARPAPSPPGPGDAEERLPFEIHAVRPTYRVHPDGRTKLELLLTITQRRKLTLKHEDGSEVISLDGEAVSFRFRGGCTVVIDPESGCPIYAISKDIRDELRLSRDQQFLRERMADLGLAALDRYALQAAGGDDPSHRAARLEPLSLLHRGDQEGDW